MKKKCWIVFDAIIWLDASVFVSRPSMAKCLHCQTHSFPHFSRLYCSKWVNWTLESGKPIFEPKWTKLLHRLFDNSLSLSLSLFHFPILLVCRLSSSALFWNASGNRCESKQIFTTIPNSVLRTYAHTHTTHTNGPAMSVGERAKRQRDTFSERFKHRLWMGFIDFVLFFFLLYPKNVPSTAKQWACISSSSFHRRHQTLN